MVKRRINVHINPKINLRFPSTISSAPMLYRPIPRPLMNSRDLWTFSHFWTRSRGFEAYFPRDSFPRISRRWIRLTCEAQRQARAPRGGGWWHTPSPRPVFSESTGLIWRTASLELSLLAGTQGECHFEDGGEAEYTPLPEGLVLGDDPLGARGHGEADVRRGKIGGRRSSV